MAVDDHGDEEADPFLPDEVEASEEEAHRPAPSDKLRWRVIFTAIALILFAEIAIFMHTAPFVRIYEDITCRRWYEKNDPSKFPNGQIPEQDCKNEAIQSEVAIVRGFQELFDGLVGKEYASRTFATG